ncbi:MAG: AraC family transcriptional regulator [Clostridia bacterium]|nr:AraC family transcriptional regulator [Clostridia bacterium]
MFYQSQHSFDADGIKVESGMDFNFPAHLHSSFEFITVLDGNMIVTVDKTPYSLKKGDCVLVFPNQVHEFSTSEHSRHLLCIFSPKLVKAYSTVFKEKIPVNNMFKLKSFYIEAMKELCGDHSIIQTKGLLYSLCGEFDKNAEYKKREEDRDELLSKIFAFVEANYAKDCSLTDLAEHTSYHYVYLSKYFKGCIGISFTDYVNRYRVNEACYRLRNNSGETILQIAYDCGFDSLRTFNRNFRKFMNITPSDYQATC